MFAKFYLNNVRFWNLFGLFAVYEALIFVFFIITNFRVSP